MSEIPYKIYLSEKEIPTAWYNVRADMKNKPAPLLNPGTGEPLKAEDLYPIFCEELSKQEMNNDDQWIDIPGEIVDFYKMYRPSPLVRAYCLEKELDTPAHIYYKFEGNNTSGSPRDVHPGVFRLWTNVDDDAGSIGVQQGVDFLRFKAGSHAFFFNAHS